ncbi:hypothetical protein [Nocardioides sp. TF02-7]|uniref:hypothetical protein n=1 Tax=Nocardioides sp. TF02-7 TaxID=2917724 RepID=UPI001F057885|nr:hypothetical protein [Nocardioides sp. TF02-7]UMG94615.1 hypothetical protein MF408_12085 [Nocardioides sp. TF02-7]
MRATSASHCAKSSIPADIVATRCSTRRARASGSGARAAAWVARAAARSARCAAQSPAKPAGSATSLTTPSGPSERTHRRSSARACLQGCFRLGQEHR